jgi:CubicO group peptidase (beta-lactamase class C family)
VKNVQSQMQKFVELKVEEGKERGIQLAVYYRGEIIVEACAGVADSLSGRTVDEKTLFPVFSVTKGLVATVIHILAEQGKLDYDRRICEIWPEFGEKGKDQVTIRHALTHTMGIPMMPEGTGLADAVDWNRMCEAVAQMSLSWEPGERMEYHARTFGWVLGEVVRRIDGRQFSQIMKEEICIPLNIEDMYVGIPDQVEPRIAILEEPDFNYSSLPPSGPQAIASFEWLNSSEARRACVPSTNGIMTARAIAKHYAALLPGGVDGIELLPQSRVLTAKEPLRLQNGVPINMSLGYRLGTVDSMMGSRPAVFGHPGYGGSIAFADPDYHMAVGLARNRLSNNGANAEIIHELKKVMGVPID